MTLFSMIFGSKSAQTDTIKVLSASAFKEAISNKKVELVDVRTAQEFKKGAIEKAKNIDFFQQNKFNTAFEKLDKDKPVYLYCQSGNRSGQASRKLDAMGFKEIYDFKGGYSRWPYKK
ncbi:rhodanese-like domain-containing protein [Subsaximicrobium wynnwilliamsii]|uniref:Rhodanese-like domain-containing protein n=1 Tax=Subsaximicrobium wynnwilliamsii TaxID=291179 RepID=A0A5C6ZN31_9FLAO|nr:rhodanese-like domain-containing protein [Subsaximicrobium wynnwilliamsii]TXD84409.1 rhodanese-like domain-containing protein [Subsaximicrobium wynnwilliamsii]TXD90090.1 rhodanese-like domain-containing protein [Subsaximicrobium wynnwilliamsii]TXE04142.1 rhodanese-like domain-containing protein [Subsaximicrobium wynnwilliamsii]